MSFDKIFDLTAGVYFNFYNIYRMFLRWRGGSSGGAVLSMTQFAVLAVTHVVVRIAGRFAPCNLD